MALLEVVTGAVFIVNAFKVGDIFLWLRITQRSFSFLFHYTTLYICTYHSALYFCLCQYTTLYICTYHPALYLSPVSVHNIIYLHISPIVLFLSCFSTQHCISARITHRSISLLFQYTTLYICRYQPSDLFLSCFSTQHCIFAHITTWLYFSPDSVHNMMYVHISPIALILSCFSTQHCISAHITTALY